MKRFIGVLISAIMILSTFVISYAAPVAELKVSTDVYSYNKAIRDFNTVVSSDITAVTNLDCEASFAIPLVGYNTLTEDDVKGYKAFFISEVGKLNDISLSYVKCNGVYGYCVVITTNYTVKGADVYGKIAVTKTANNAKEATGVNAKFAVLPAASVVATGATDWEFEDCGFRFLVDASGEGSKDMAVNNNFDKVVAAKYPEANLDFITFTKVPVFNRTGTAWIYADEDKYIYKVEDGKAVAIKGLAFDEDEQVWVFKTRELGEYVISDIELTTTTKEAEKPATPVKVNPNTGR